MEHIIHVAFDFDDNAVKKRLEETVERDVKENIKQYVIDQIFEKQWAGYGRESHAKPERDPLQEWVRDYIKELVSEHKEDICRAAAKEIVESMSKSKKWKELIVEAVKENNK